MSDRDDATPAVEPLFPRAVAELADRAKCPSCFTVIEASPCAVCGLDLQHPLTVRLGEVSSEAARLLDTRVRIMRSIREQTARAAQQKAADDAEAMAAERSAPAQAAATSAPTLVASDLERAADVVHAPAPHAPANGVPPTVPAAPSRMPADAAPRESRRPSAQVLLLGVGVTLLAIAAIFFTIYAFVTFGLLVRALIIGAVTVGAVAGATLLRRRRLVGTAEAVAALAVILILLDVWAVRANALLGLDAAPPDLYWGIALVLAAVGLRAWQARSGLRVPGLSGALALPLGAALAAGGLSSALDSSDALMLAGIAASVAALAHPLFAPKDAPPSAAPMAQRIILLTWAVLGLAVAVATVPAVAANLSAAPSVALVLLAALVAVHAVVLARYAPEHPWRTTAVTVAVAVATALVAVSPAAFALRVDSSFTRLALPLLGAAGIALIAEVVQRRMARAATVRPAAITAGAIALVFSLVPLSVLVIFASTGPLLAVQDPRWILPAGELRAPTPDVVLALVAVAVTVAVTAVVWLRVLALYARRVLVIAASALVLTLAAPLLGALWAVVAGWMLLSVAALWWLLLRRPVAMTAPSGVIAASGAVNLALGYLASWAGLFTWLVATPLVIAILLVSRRVFARTPLTPKQQTQCRAALLALAAGLAFVGVAGVGGLGTGVSMISLLDNPARDVAVGMLALAIVVMTVVALPLGASVTTLDRRVLFWMAAVIGAASALSLRFGLVSAGTPAWLPLLLSLGLLAAILLWSFSPVTRDLRVERIAAAIAVAPALSWMLESFATVLNLPAVLGPVARITAALLVSAAALVSVLRSTPTVPRVFSDAGIVAVTVLALIGAVVVPSELTWLALLLAALTVLLQSVSADGLFGSQSPRRHVGWVAFALATAALWTRLFDDAVTAVEPFILPVAAVFAAIAVLVARAAARRGQGASAVAPALLLIGLLLALVPSALQGVTGPADRSVVITAVSALLLFAAIFTPVRASWRPFALAAVIAGAAGVCAAAIGRALVLTPLTLTGDEAEVWLGVGCGVLFVAALALLWRHHEPAQHRERIAVVLLLVAGTSLFTVEMSRVVLNLTIALQSSRELRVLVLVVVFCAAHVAAALARSLPSRAVLTWLPIAYASIAALTGLVFGVFDPTELATLPIAVALLITGAERMRQHPELRSWPGLGAGVVLLLVPSLLITTYDNALWRLLVLGAASIAVMVAGIVLRLQAPFVAGAIVVLIHGIATFSPQIRLIYEATPWWLWVAIGGALLLFLGATYEKRARDLRKTVGRISALR